MADAYQCFVVEVDVYLYFRSEVDAYLYDVSLDGGADEEVGSSTEGAGWYGLMRAPLVNEKAARKYGLTDDEIDFLKSKAGAIIVEDTNGFVSVEYFDTSDELENAWSDVLADVEAQETMDE